MSGTLRRHFSSSAALDTGRQRRCNEAGRGLLAIALAIVAGVPPATAQTVTLYAFRASDCHVLPPATMGASLNTSDPAAVILGHLPPPGAVGEVAVAQRVITAGEDVPLPSFADGTPAQDSEVFWSAQLWLVEFPLACGVVEYRSDYATATFNRRRLVSTVAQIANGGRVPPSTSVQVLVTAIAFRPQDRRRIKPQIP